jgi:predicted methyltransferase
MLALAFVAAPASLVAAAPSANVSSAVASPTRDADNVKLDESRKPAEVLRFFGLQRGMQVLDLFGANRYWSEIMAPAVGPSGHVTVWEPTQFYKGEAPKAFDAFAARQKNVSLLTSAFETPNLPRNKFDFAILNLNYHDVYWQSEKYGISRMDPDVWLKTLNGAMKRGGIVGVIDHVANPNKDTRAMVEAEHRIDPEVVKRDFRHAGFALVGTSNMLRNSADDHSLLVFDPKIRGKTDRFVMKFRKIR